MAKQRYNRLPTIEELQKRCIVTSTECWEWQGSKNGAGYGALTVSGIMQRVHRVMMHISTGFDLNSGLYILHKCDNPPCINPAHLFVGTQSDNLRDAARKGRLYSHGVRGSKHVRSRLFEADVVTIRSLEPYLSQREIAKLYHVDKSNVWRILRRKTWVHI